MLTIYTELEWLLRILLAGVAGFFIGSERHSRSKEAGIRTHTIVAIASAMLMILSKYGFYDIGDGRYDAARIAAQVVSGIGFLGAGIIFVRHDTIQGLTTAAGIWATSGIGMCFGAGMYLLGLATTVIIMIVHLCFTNSRFMNSPRTTIHLMLQITKDASIRDIASALRKLGYSCIDNKIVKDPNDPSRWVLYMEVATLRPVEPALLLSQMKEQPFIINIEIAE